MDPLEIKSQIDQALKPLLEKLNALEAENQQIRTILKNANLPKTIPKPHTAVSTHANNKKPVPATVKPNETGHKPVHQKKEEPKIQKKVEDATTSEGAGNSQQIGASQKKQHPPVKPPVGTKPTTAVKKTPAPGVEVGKKVPPTATKTPVVGHKGPVTNTKIKTESAQEEEKKQEESGKKKSISKAVDKPLHGAKTHHSNKTPPAPKQPVDDKNAKKEVEPADKKSEEQKGAENHKAENIEKKEQQAEVVTDNLLDASQKQNTNQQTSQKVEQPQPEVAHPQNAHPQSLQNEEEVKNNQQPADPTSEQVKEAEKSPEVATQPVQAEQAEEPAKASNEEPQVQTEIEAEKKAEEDEVI